MGRKKKGDMSANKIRVSFTIDPNLVEALTQLANEQGKKLSSISEDAIREYLENHSVEYTVNIKPEVKQLKRGVYVEPASTH
jgi:predicted transcriptional regulator